MANKAELSCRRRKQGTVNRWEEMGVVEAGKE